MELFIYCFAIIQILFSVTALPASGPTLEFFLVISCDGFRWDYLDVVRSKGRATPNFDYLVKSGVKAEYVQNAFVTMTWPNHWTMSTGLYVESHGIVNNHFYDPTISDTYDGPRSPESYWYNNEGAGGEPFWVTYQNASSDNHAGSAVWPGGVIEVNGVNATYSLPQDNEIPLKDRVDAVFSWFTKDKDPAHLAMLYFGEPDKTGHIFGPDSQELVDKIVELDGMMGYIIDKLHEHQLLSLVNLIISSDHGMTNVIDTYRLVDYIPPWWYTLSGDSPNFMFLPIEGKEKEVFQALQTIPHSTVHKKADFPEEFHYARNARIMPYILMMEEGYMTCCEDGGYPGPSKGEHGYDNKLDEMHPFFIAHGPTFKSGFIAEPFNNTDIYPLMCHLLGVEPKPNNGSLENIRHILREGNTLLGLFSTHPASLSQLSTAIISFLIMFFLATALALLYFFVRKQPFRSRTPKALSVDIPDSHPDYQLAKYRGDREWLLASHDSEQSDKEEDEVEEWQPLRHSKQQPIQCTAVTEQTPV